MSDAPDLDRRFDAFIIAGGAASRFGGACKPLLLVGDRAILARQLEVLAPLANEVSVVANDAAPFAGYDVRVVPDLRPGRGPLAGLEAALCAASTEHVLVVAGDMPLLAAAPLRLILDADPAAEAVVPVGARGPEPLCARYARRLLPRVSAAIDAGRLALHRFLDEIDAHRIDEAALRAVDPRLSFLANLNTPQDLRDLETAAAAN